MCMQQLIDLQLHWLSMCSFETQYDSSSVAAIRQTKWKKKKKKKKNESLPLLFNHVLIDMFLSRIKWDLIDNN